jgi:hypothetical protein
VYELTATTDGLEIGSTGPGELQFTVDAQGQRVAVKMTAEDARWLAMALNHWADVSEGKAAGTRTN